MKTSSPGLGYIEMPAIPHRTISLRINGVEQSTQIEDREILARVVREQAGLKGTHIGCYGGDCGACTVVLDGKIVKSCLVLAASVDGSEITTVEGLGDRENLDPVQQAFWDEDAFQCGYCVPGFLFVTHDLLVSNPDPSDEEIREALIGNICRCTGYHNIVNAVKQAAAVMRKNGSDTPTVK
jgi:aerobic-type carbon monoxide dehydrogenase small subunit (CoxS/CutS family)